MDNLLFILAQIGVGLLAPLAFFLVLRTSVKAQAYGVVVGWLSQPCWYATVYFTDQWLTLPVHMFYTYVWVDKTCRMFKEHVTPPWRPVRYDGLGYRR